MAERVEQLVIELKAEVSGLRAGLTDAQGRLRSFASQGEREMNRLDMAMSRVGRAAVTYFSGAAILSFARSTLNASMQMQSLDAKMTAAVGSSTLAGQSLRFVREESERLGLVFTSTADGFASFSASATRAGLALTEVKGIFRGVSEASAALQLAPERVELVFMALSQMASKGKVSMEELRQQLGESLPGAVQIFAQAMGKTPAEFEKMVTNGEVGVDALTKFGDALHNEFAVRAVEASQLARANLARLTNAVFDLQVAMAKGEAIQAYTDTVKRLAETVSDPEVQQGLADLAGGIGYITEIAVVGTATIARWTAQMYEAAKAWLAFEMAGGDDNPNWKTAGPMNICSGSLAASGGALSRELGGSTGAARPTLSKSGGKKEKDPLRELKGDLEATKNAVMSPEERDFREYERRQKVLEEALQKKLITESMYRNLGIQNELTYQQTLTDQQREALSLRQADLEEFADAFLGVQTGMQYKTLKEQGQSLAASISQAAQHNKAFFMLEKAAALARAAISARQSVVDAYAFGVKLGGPALGAVFAGVAAAAQAANIAAIASTTYGGGDSGVGAAGGSGLTTGGSDELARQNNANTGATKNVFITIEGEEAFFGPTQLRKLVNGLNEAIGDGQIKLNVVGAG